MQKNLVKRSAFMIIMLACLLLIIILGAGIAYADPVEHYLSVGTYYYYGTHDEEIWSGETYYYDLRHRVNMSSDFSDITFYTTRYYNGSSNDPDNICFGPYYIWDEYGNHSVYYDDFLLSPIDGFSSTATTSWFYGSMNSTNNIVVAEQYVWKWADDDYTSLGSDYSMFQTQ
jgi:hypothetical protein